jgi:cytochrome c2
MTRLLFLFAVLISLTTVGFFAEAQDAANGEKVFKQVCTACHSVSSKKEAHHLGPALYGTTKKPGRTESWLIAWISDPEGMIKKKDPLALQILKEYNNVPMTNMLSNLYAKDAAKVEKAAKDILAYLKKVDAAPDAATAAAEAGPKKKKN